ncbi:hypothetical protein BVRB_029590 [Beta vulgaris subsp. vulgaris]|uniref:Uncharacterized protein n=1 Tax=Beta vulgaris subsp. vulgaris TaxID=3555 RepID=A0A0J8DSB7_BETVV|nr:hypothetical protein BVRB_029590 [Beta vulgaris subsp. vulgaris]
MSSSLEEKIASAEDDLKTAKETGDIELIKLASRNLAALREERLFFLNKNLYPNLLKTQTKIG